MSVSGVYVCIIMSGCVCESVCVCACIRCVCESVSGVYVCVIISGVCVRVCVCV